MTSLVTFTGVATVVAYVTKGLDEVALAEVTRLVGPVRPAFRSDRFFAFTVEASDILALARESRTIDDLRLLVAGPRDVTSEQEFASFCVEAGLAAEAALGPDRVGAERWSVTVSAKGAPWTRSRWSPADALGAALHGASPRDTERQPVDLRLQVDGKTMHMSLNLFARPFGKRQTSNRPGALRPTIAAAMVQRALDGQPANVVSRGVYDAFCGSGTILLEAVEAGHPFFGSDVSAEAVELARERLAPAIHWGGPSFELVAKLKHRIFVGDAREPWPNRVTAATLVSNLPWGKQVEVNHRSEVFAGAADLAATAAQRGGRSVLLTTHEDQLIAAIRRTRRVGDVSAHRLGLLGQTPALVVVEPA